MSLNFNSIPTKTLSESITSAASSFKLNNITGWDGVDLVAGDFGTVGYGIFVNANKTQIELFEFDPSTIASASITINKRGLKFTGDLTTEVSGNKLSWTKGDTYVNLGTDTPQMLQWLKEYIDGIAIAGAPDASTTTKGIVKMSTAPASPTSPIAVGDNDPRVPTTDISNALAGTPGTPSATNKFVTQAKSVTAGATINGGTLPVPVYQNKTDNEFYACDANDTAAMKFLGFAISNGTDGNAMNVQFSGIVSGFTGLLEGEKYYVQDTAGTISTTIGTYEILVGIAISETELLIQKGTRRAAGAGGSVGTATGSLAVTCGFRPSIVRLNGFDVLSAGSTMSAFKATWTNGAITAVAVGMDAGGTEVIDNNPRLYQPNAPVNFMVFSITSVTDTGFTISWAENGTYTGQGYFHWEAEGEL